MSKLNNQKAFGAVITRLMNGAHLDRREARQCWEEIIGNRQPDLQQGAFMAALSMKGETREEIAGAYEAIFELDTRTVDMSHLPCLVDNCGTGMDFIKTFNISTAASIVAAADGVPIAKHGARAITSTCGTVDVMEAVGVDVECDVSMVAHSVETAGIGVFNGMSRAVHPEALFRILSQIRFGSTLNVAGSLANPARPKLGVRGVYSPHMVASTAEVMGSIGYREALVFHGWNDDKTAGMDELSTLGESLIARLLPDGTVTTERMCPEDVGLKRREARDVCAAPDVATGAMMLVRVMANRTDPARADIVCLNAAPILLVAGKVDDMGAGVARARELLESGAAMATLEKWVGQQNREPSSGRARLAAIVEAL